MKRLAATILLIALSVAIVRPLASAESAAEPQPRVDTSSSETLTDFLRRHRLPLVGAQVTIDSRGDQQVMLYGYVATSFGKFDAEERTRKYLKQPTLKIVNRIKVRPEILLLKHKTAGSIRSEPLAPEEHSPPQGSGSDSWSDIMRDIHNNSGNAAPAP